MSEQKDRSIAEFDTIIERLETAADSIKTDNVPLNLCAVIPPIVDHENFTIKRLLRGALALVKRRKAEQQELISRARNYEKVISNFDRFIGNFGFRRLGTGYDAAFTHQNLSYCYCGKQPRIQFVETDNEWCVLCTRCYRMTANYKKIKDAMQAWREHNYTETSKMLQKRLTLKNVDEEGLMELAKAVCKTAAEDYIDSTSESKESLQRFFRTSPLMLGADGDAVIDNLDKIAQEKEKKKEGRKTE